jgi:SAM-dependent methyltransferase
MTDTPKNPWDYMGAEERRILGDVVADPAEQARWCKAMVFGTLPYMWRDKAAVVRELAYDKMELKRGRGGLLATWQWLYSRDLPDRSFDAVAVMQATQHTDDWRETGADLLRVLKPGRPIVITEITLSPHLKMKAQLDVHIEAWIDKIFSRIGWDFDQTPYHSLADLRRAFDGLADAPGSFDWRGIELFWARNKH